MKKQNIKNLFFKIIFKDFIYLFLERGRERERNIHVWLPLLRPLLGVLDCNPGMSFDWEWKQVPFGLLTCTQSTEPPQLGQNIKILNKESDLTFAGLISP